MSTFRLIQSASNITTFPGDTVREIEPDTVLGGAEGLLSDVLVIGIDAEGKLYVAGSSASTEHLNWLLDRAKAFLMDL